MIFVDMDGVLADFDLHYYRHFGVRPTRWPDPETVDWSKIAAIPDFFLTIPVMDGALELLHGIYPRPFEILTGVSKSIDTTKNQKIEWIHARIEPALKVNCCRSRDKYQYGKPGDVLIDDYLKYKDRWVAMGGIFIHHTSAASSLRRLWELGL